MSEPRAFVLFDIDGTLLSRAGPHHKMALVEAIRKVTRRDTSFDGIDTSGMLDRDLIRILLRSTGAANREIDQWMPAIVEFAQRHYGTICPLLHDRVCPGVVDFLEKLQRERIPAGLVTGNLTAIGWKKMESSGLRSFFEVGAFADMARTRSGLARIALREGRRKGLITRKTAVSLVGDHANDIRAAKLNRIRSIAVATGVSTPDELAAHHPDVLVPDLRSLRLESLL
ncbi:MAG TPA: HAD hydrolase-like protein [Bryobacteraceae bacterium]|nr:HAD hydrolase-like protein [Bryobacteraceae bacterium]